jgi:hypothetical protein
LSLITISGENVLVPMQPLRPKFLARLRILRSQNVAS